MPSSSPIPTPSTDCGRPADRLARTSSSCAPSRRRTASPGCASGYAVGHPRIIDAARSASIPLSVTAHAEEAALASLDAEAELLERVRDIAERRDRLAAGLRDAGWNVPVAQGNFVWLPAGDQTQAIAEAFDAAGLIVRPFAGDGIRISVGEEESVEKVLRIAGSVVESLPEGHPGRGASVER